MSSQHHVAQLNIARMIPGNIQDPIMADFVPQLEVINMLAEQSDGFVWRLRSDNPDRPNQYGPYNDERLIINFSVWESVEYLKKFVYQSAHAAVMKEKDKWFERLEKPHYVIWKIEPGYIPSVEEALEKLEQLQKNGATEEVFDFRYLLQAHSK